MKDAKDFLNGYLASLIHKRGISSQFVLSFEDFYKNGFNDPLSEENFTKKKGLIHRYPDRVVLTVTNRCFAYCRFCFRKKNWQDFEGFDLDGAVEYIDRHKTIREVLISGGDPLTLSDEGLKRILSKLNSIKHIRFLRIGTRVFSSNPSKINKNFTDMLKNYKPIWIAAHINHPDEITNDFKKAVSCVLNAGIPVISQSVLLKGINDNVKILEKLFCKLVEVGVKPYYLFGCDYALANGVFRVPIEQALDIMNRLRGKISGLCVPTFAFDLQEGGGKVVIEPDRIVKRKGRVYIIRNFEGKEFEYIDV